jgi:hypothetical protein
MSELMQANRQWSTRPSDERFTSLTALASFCTYQRQHSARRTLANRDLTVVPSTTDDYDIALVGPNGHPAQFTHWGFSQLCSLAGVPSSYIRSSAMPGPLAADNLNWGLHHHRDVESVSTLLRRTEEGVFLGAVNGPDYGVIWNAEVADAAARFFGDGISGQWRVPGEFGSQVPITQDNTTLYASDRDMWIFLADEERRIEVENRRNGQSGALARGFYISNSEVGASTLTLGMFLFDYVCCNRIIWGAQQHTEIKVRHTAGAPHRWVEEIKPILREYAEASPANVADTIRAAKAAKIKGDVSEFLSKRFGKGMASTIALAHLADEFRPVETVWDAVTGATAYARTIQHVDARVKVERTAGDLLKMVA